MRNIYVLVGCEESQAVTIELRRLGIKAFSCDFKVCSGGRPEWHIRADVLQVLAGQPFVTMSGSVYSGVKWDGGIFFPDCTYLTCSAEWAYKDPDFVRYPGVGYHQKLRPGTLFGESRRAAREWAKTFFRTLYEYGKIGSVAVENPIGVMNGILRPSQIIHPYMFGDDASKSTCLWLRGFPVLLPNEGDYVLPRTYCKKCGTIEQGAEELVYKALKDGCIECGDKVLPRWGNQTDSGQNRLSPSEDRAEQRSKTYPGIARAMAEQWGGYLISKYGDR